MAKIKIHAGRKIDKSDKEGKVSPSRKPAKRPQKSAGRPREMNGVLEYDDELDDTSVIGREADVLSFFREALE